MKDKDYSDFSKLVGKRVIRRDAVVFEDDEQSCEVGIILHAWTCSELNAIDCYVAFFGGSWPESNKNQSELPMF